MYSRYWKKISLRTTPDVRFGDALAFQNLGGNPQQGDAQVVRTMAPVDTEHWLVYAVLHRLPHTLKNDFRA